MLKNLFRKLFPKREPKPPKFIKGDLVMFDNLGIDYEARVLGYDHGAGLIALEVISSSAPDKGWKAGRKLTLSQTTHYRAYNTIMVIERVSDKELPCTDVKI